MPHLPWVGCRVRGVSDYLLLLLIFDHPVRVAADTLA
jgi:hypothetical protein